MNKKLTWIALGAAVAGMGIAMPSCPGQQAMQQQIDALQAKNAEMAKHIQNLDNQVKADSNDMGQVKTLLSQVSNTVLAQKQAQDALEAQVKELTTKVNTPPPAAKGKKRK